MRLDHITPKIFGDVVVSTGNMPYKLYFIHFVIPLVLKLFNSFELGFDLVQVSSLLSDNSKCDPPDPIPNSEVKPLSADGSVGSPHVRVGHC